MMRPTTGRTPRLETLRLVRPAVTRIEERASRAFVRVYGGPNGLRNKPVQTTFAKRFLSARRREPGAAFARVTGGKGMH